MLDPASVRGFHPFAGIFPLLEGPEFDELVEDIRANGLIFPIVLYDNQIIDGRNRYRACVIADVEPKFLDYPLDRDALSFVVTANLKRRHLNDSQRALCAARIATMPQGRPRTPAVKQSDAAKMFNIGTRTVKQAAVVRDRAIPELVARVDRGEVTVNLAERLANMPTEQQREVVDLPSKALVGVAKRFAREERMEELRAPIAQAASELDAPEQLYPVLVVDPPWRFEPYSRETGMDRAADNHYPTMTTTEICSLNIPATKDSVLFLWATAPMLSDALEVMKSWGFAYKSHMIWLKSRVATGYWFRNQHELLLVGTRGNIPAPAPGTQYNSVHSADTRQHSEKPAKFFEIIEDMFPGLQCCELFARERRAGWATWGTFERESADA